MKAFDRRALLALLVGAAIAGSGCDVQTMAYFLMPEAREDAILKHLASDDPKKDPRVVILTYTNGLETRAEFIQADRCLADQLADQLKKLADTDQQKLTVLPQRKVETYKNTHPNWKEMDLHQIGRALGADYVIYLEITSLSLYEKNSFNQFLRGRAEITASVAEVAKPDEEPKSNTVTVLYPSEARGGVSAFDSNPVEFRQKFLKQVAKELSYQFSRYPKRDSQFMDGPSPF